MRNPDRAHAAHDGGPEQVTEMLCQRIGDVRSCQSADRIQRDLRLRDQLLLALLKDRIGRHIRLSV